MRTYEVTRKATEHDECYDMQHRDKDALAVDTVEANSYMPDGEFVSFLIDCNRVISYHHDQVLFIEDVTETDPA